jgi:hypothetical protein
MRLALAASLALPLAAAPSAAHADALLTEALANGGAYNPAEWAYVSVTKVWTGGTTVVGDAVHKLRDGERPRPPLRSERVVQFDPTKPAGQRLRVVRETVDKQVEVRADETDDFPAYSELAKLVQGTPKLVAQTSTTATYRGWVDPAKVRNFGSVDIESSDPLPPLAGTFTVQKSGPGAPYVKSVVIALPTGEKGRGNAVGKVRQMSFGFRYAPDPQKGVKLLQAFGMDSSLQGLGLVTIDFSLLTKVAGYRYVGK